jgi:hypothetical protein
MKSKKTIIMNGRWSTTQRVGSKQQTQSHIYICAYNISDACRMCEKLTGRQSGWRNEIKNYFSIGSWGNTMDGIKQEHGAWVSENYGKPERVL